MAQEFEVLLNRSKEVGHNELAEHTQKALVEVNGIISIIEDIQSTFLESIGAVNIPIVRKDRPKLTLIKGGLE